MSFDVNKLMKELTGQVEMERDQQRQRNKAAVIAEGVALGETEEGILSSFDAYEYIFHFYERDWLDIPGWTEWVKTRALLYEWQRCDDSDDDPRTWRYWVNQSKEHPECPIIAALADRNEKWDDVASLPAVEGDIADQDDWYLESSVYAASASWDNHDKDFAKYCGFDAQGCVDLAAVPARVGDPETDIDIEAIIAQHQVDLLEDLGICPKWASANLDLYQRIDLDLVIRNKRTVKELLQAEAEKRGFPDCIGCRTAEEYAQSCVDSWEDWWIHHDTPIRTLDEYRYGFVQWCKGVKHNPYHRLGDPTWDPNGDDVDPDDLAALPAVEGDPDYQHLGVYIEITEANGGVYPDEDELDYEPDFASMQAGEGHPYWEFDQRVETVMEMSEANSRV